MIVTMIEMFPKDRKIAINKSPMFSSFNPLLVKVMCGAK